MSDRDEVERRLANVEHEISQLRAIFQRQTMQQIGTASPRVVAGPLRFTEGQEVGFATIRGNMAKRVLTHPACLAPCLTCDDDGRPDGEAA